MLNRSQTSFDESALRNKDHVLFTLKKSIDIEPYKTYVAKVQDVEEFIDGKINNIPFAYLVTGGGTGSGIYKVIPARQEDLYILSNEAMVALEREDLFQREKENFHGVAMPNISVSDNILNYKRINSFSENSLRTEDF